MFRVSLSACLALVLVSLVGCGEDTAAPVVEDDTPISEDGLITFHKDLRPLMEANCNGCHDGSGITPPSLDFVDPAQVQALAPAILAAVESRTMPPWQANEGCNDYKDDLGLSLEEINTFKAWSEDGLILGEESDFVMPEIRPSELTNSAVDGPPSITVRSEKPYEPDTNIPDDFRCFTIDPQLDSDKFLQGYEVKVDNISVLHHLLVFVVPGDEENLQLLDELEAEDDQPGYSCFGTSRTDVDSLAAVWAPGGDKQAFPIGTGLKIDKDARFVIQMHYNLSEGGSGVDQSGIDLWFADEDKEAEIKEAQMIFIGNLPFEIPANINGTTSETCDTIYTVSDDFSTAPAEGIDEDTLEDASEVGKSGCVQQDIYYTITAQSDTVIHSVFPHMHLKGKNLKAEILPVELEDGFSVAKEDEGHCLLDTDRWDFDWQRSYWFKEPIIAPRRGTVRLTCRFDNEGSDEAVELGDGSGNEMCLILLFLTQTDG